MQRSLAGGPALVGANWFRFRAGDTIFHPEVASVSFIWPVTGSGTIRTCGTSFRLDPTVLLRLPWRHDVEYVPDARSPFNLGTIHLVPEHAEGAVTARVAYLQNDPLLRSPVRRGQKEAPELISRRTASGRRLVELGSYAVDRFHQDSLETDVLRSLGVLIVDADDSRARDAPYSEGAPPALEWMTVFVRSNLERALTVADIAAAGSCSIATAERLFVKHLGQSVIAWSRRQQLDEAARLLRTTGLPVREIAELVGYSDPLYFSRAFRALHSVPPSRYSALQLRP